jgi:hypothetical protein
LELGGVTYHPRVELVTAERLRAMLSGSHIGAVRTSA